MTSRTLLKAGFVSALLVLTGTALAMGPGGRGAGGCGGQGGGAQMGGGGGDGACVTDMQAEVVELSSQAASELIRMREEEKLAHDVYLAMHEKWGAQVFGIRNAELKHMGAMKKMLDRFGMEDPIVDQTPGVFASEVYSDLYVQLVESGSESLMDAYKVGAKIEELDLFDLRTASDGVGDQVLTKVYGNLERATRNHLRAFAAQIEANGGSYEAEHLTQAEFDTIASSDFERGHGAGQGKGQTQDNALGQGKGKRGKAMQGQGQGKGQGQGQGCGLCKG